MNVYEELKKHGLTEEETKYIAKHGGKKAAKAHLRKAEVLSAAYELHEDVPGFPPASQINNALEAKSTFLDQVKTFQEVEKKAAKQAGISKKTAFGHHNRQFVSLGDTVQKPANASKWSQ